MYLEEQISSRFLWLEESRRLFTATGQFAVLLWGEAVMGCAVCSNVLPGSTGPAGEPRVWVGGVPPPMSQDGEYWDHLVPLESLEELAEIAQYEDRRTFSDAILQEMLKDPVTIKATDPALECKLRPYTTLWSQHIVLESLRDHRLRRPPPSRARTPATRAQMTLVRGSMVVEPELAVKVSRFAPYLMPASVVYESKRWPFYTLGVKTTPVSLMEASHPGDVRYMLWRELYVDQLCANLVINRVAFGFPMVAPWTYVENGHAGLFSNYPQRRRYEQAQVVQEMRALLQQANAKAEEVSAHLHSHIGHALAYTDARVALSDIIVMKPVEYVGLTAADIGQGLWGKFHFILELFKDPAGGRSVLFDYLFSLYALNSKCRSLHGDLHGGNSVVNMKYGDLTTTTFVTETATFKVPRHLRGMGFIIDFSRSICFHKDEFIESQQDMLVVVAKNALTGPHSSTAPEVLAAFEGLAKSHPRCAFSALTLLDVVTLVRGWLSATLPITEAALFPPEDPDADVEAILKPFRQLSSKLEVAALELFSEMVLAVGPKDPDAFASPMPILKLLERFWGDYKVPNDGTADFCVRRDLKLDIFDPKFTEEIYADEERFEKFEGFRPVPVKFLEEQKKAREKFEALMQSTYRPLSAQSRGSWILK